jgi:GNAT superfamily N-acetyltransferase
MGVWAKSPNGFGRRCPCDDRNADAPVRSHPQASVRRATPEDAESVLACLKASFAPYESLYTAKAYEDTVLSHETYFRRLQEMTILVAETPRHEVIGTIAYVVVAQGHGHLRGMAVRPEFQGRGIARLLIQAAEDGLRGLDCARVTLNTTQPLRKAVRFYESCGYRANGKTRDLFGMPLTEHEKSLALETRR